MSSDYNRIKKLIITLENSNYYLILKICFLKLKNSALLSENLVGPKNFVPLRAGIDISEMQNDLARSGAF